MNNILEDIIKLLNDNYIFVGFEIVIKNISVDGIIKFLFDLKDVNLIEMVLMSYNYGMSVCVII